MTVQVPIDMEAFEDAVHDWFTESTELETIWRNPSAPQPDYPYASLMIIAGPIPTAPQWELRTTTDLNRPAGQEVKLNVVVPCTFTVSCQVYVGMVDARNPDYNARYYINAAQSALSLPSVLAALREDGIAVVRPGPIQNIDEVIEDAYVSRAGMDVTFSASLSLEEFTGYIKTVQVKSVSLGIDENFGDI